MDMRSSPFPGMDPYLESPHGWADVHARLIAAIGDYLSERILPAFFVRIEERVYITAPGDPDRQAIEPDVSILRESGVRFAAAGAGITPPVLIERTDLEPEIHDRFLTIVDTAGRATVTTIELLSPFNKRPGAQGYAAFQRKRSAVMASPVHWIEIDLLRAGLRPAEVAERSDYYSLLQRGDRWGAWEVWFFNLRMQMPTIAVPLRPPYDDVPLDLQAVLSDVYRRSGYGFQIDYQQSVPPPPLRPEDEPWAQERIAHWRAENRSTS